MPNINLPGVSTNLCHGLKLCGCVDEMVVGMYEPKEARRGVI